MDTIYCWCLLSTCVSVVAYQMIQMQRSIISTNISDCVYSVAPRPCMFTFYKYIRWPPLIDLVDSPNA